MPDRSLRLAMHTSQPLTTPDPRAMPLLREGRLSSPGPGSDAGDQEGASGAEGAAGQGSESAGQGSQGGRDAQGGNPFAPPPEGAPDQPWRPRQPTQEEGEGSGGEGRSPWGRWSDRQPGRSQDGFGDRPGAGPEGQGNNQAPGPRWDPTDPAQRRARYSLLGGMWSVFFVLFGWAYVALLLGALSVYWAVSALRARPRQNGSEGAAPDSPASPSGSRPGGRPQRTAAISGLVTASLALTLVGAGFTSQLVYRDYYTCRADALTDVAQQSCNDLLPKQLRELLGTSD